MIGYIFLAITAAIILAICMQIDNWQRDWTTNFAETDASDADPDLHPWILNHSSRDVADRISEWTASKSGWELVGEEEKPDDSIRLHLTRTTRVFRFVDDIHVTIAAERHGEDSDPHRSIVTASSQSRVGKGDLGQNPRNLKQLATVFSNW
tara:strand:+ start:36156 stop:36608 length:453 start_codon:yes stop_codon:yes gene_type:complete